MLYINCLFFLFLKYVYWSDMFIGRLKLEILKVLVSRIVLILVFMFIYISLDFIIFNFYLNCYMI